MYLFWMIHVTKYFSTLSPGADIDPDADFVYGELMQLGKYFRSG